MTVYKVESADGRSYTVGTDNIEGVVRSVESVGMFNINDIIKIVEVKEHHGEWVAPK